MGLTMFDALVLRNDPDGFRSGIEQLSVDQLDASNPVLVQVSHSGINYKDALAVLNKGKIVRAAFPFIPGIDFVGKIQESTVSQFAPGEWVIGTGGGLGETTWGGYSGQQRIPSEYLVKLPEGMAPFDAMAIGTAGLTAALAVLRLQDYGRSISEGPIVVTGASGGVGGYSTLLLSRMGYSVVASTGKTASHGYLKELGAHTIIDRDILSRGASRPLDSAQWSGAIDSVGGKTLEALISQVSRHGCIASCGNASGAEFHTTVYPFILRGVSLCGIDSNTASVAERERAWNLLSTELGSEDIKKMATAISLVDVPSACERVFAGEMQGRYVVEL